MDCEMICSSKMKLSQQIKKLPAGKVIEVSPSAMTLVRYHARACREIKSRSNLKTGKRDVFLGDFFINPKDDRNKR
jgi:hypothetical protein